jgi:hypothetical protein
MLIFKKGEFVAGNLTGIVHFDFDEVTSDNWWDYQLSEECWILQIPKDMKEIQIYNAFQNGNHFIPRISEIESEFHDIFWNSNETFVFKSFEQALWFTSVYEGDFKTEVREFHEKVKESILVVETILQFSNLNDLDKEFDVDFMNELEGFVNSMELNINIHEIIHVGQI